MQTTLSYRVHLPCTGCIWVEGVGFVDIIDGHLILYDADENVIHAMAPGRWTELELVQNEDAKESDTDD